MLRIYLIFLVAIQSASQHSIANVISWKYTHFPPAHILEGKYKGSGYLDKALPVIQAKLPKFEHQHSFSNGARLLKEMIDSPNSCTTELLETPVRNVNLVYSKPIFKIFGNGIVTTKNNPRFEQYIASDGSIDLETLIENKDLVLGAVQHRSYKGVIDDLLNKYEGKSHIWRTTSDETELVKLLLNKKVDYIISYVAEANYVANKSFKNLPIDYFSIAGSQEYLEVKVSCSNTVVGKEVVSIVDMALGRNEVNQFGAFYFYWLPSSARKKYAPL